MCLIHTSYQVAFNRIKPLWEHNFFIQCSVSEEYSWVTSYKFFYNSQDVFNFESQMAT
jgi:hypothetical protein